MNKDIEIKERLKKASMQWDMYVLDDNWHEIKSEVMVHNKYERKLIKCLVEEFTKALNQWCELYCEEKI